MSEAIPPISIPDFLKYVRERLDQSVAIAKAAEKSADDGDTEKAVSILLGVEQQIYEANTFINAASLINRISSS